MTMAWPQLAALAGAFPDQVSFHGVERAGDLLAAAIRLRITPTHHYVFYWGEDPAWRKESPTILLAEELMADSHAAGATVLDIGTSTDDSKPNLGLITFKESLGCQTRAKRTYVLDRA
jgi:CelD/BcsL family acetyltransferase involved in cellulose biosynthesis